ncbi:MAG: hypothetical protein DHS20C05_02930 [Hyphococcus sp.]|nr:MAG: hypothetical protein DHS20C05_02930 [Marinicaulis sp.]
MLNLKSASFHEKEMPPIEYEAEPKISIILLLIVIIALLQLVYFKTAAALRGYGDFNLFSSLISSDFLFNLTVTAIVVSLHIGVSKVLRNTIPEQNVKARYALQFVLSGALAASGAALCNWVYSAVIYNFGAPSASVLFDVAVLAFMTPIILTGLLDSFYYRGQWLSEQYQKELSQREMIDAKFDALKSQLSPHFVFNSFNTLGAIITESPQRAQAFLTHLSAVYRYLLENNDKDTVSLGAELDCVAALLSLYEDRHPGVMTIDLEVTKAQRELLVVPLTLHTLIENVFKHNRLTAKSPIELKIEVQNDELLIVENSYRPKLDVESHQVGLENLSQRYFLLLHKRPNIISTNEVFRVEVPLVTKGAAT